jgi:clan AA aspartic protease (TIGR02281 family)
MGKITFSLCLIIALFFFQAAYVSADIYQWTDKSGITHVADSKEKIPDAYRDHARVVAETGQTHLSDTFSSAGEYIIPFQRMSSDTILVEVILNSSVRAKMILDTGASLIILSEELAKNLKQDVSTGGQIILHTAGGDIEGRAVLVSKVELGGASKENVRAAVNIKKGVFNDFDGLLGMSFFSDFKVTIDYPNSVIIMKKENR